MTQGNRDDIEEYGDPRIASADAPIPRWLILTYITLPIWGIICLYLFWNGSLNWVEGRPWQQLQRAANTTFPPINQNLEKQK